MHTLGYPIPSSFPDLILTDDAPHSHYGSISHHQRTLSASGITSLATTASTGELFKGYALFIEQAAKRPGLVTLCRSEIDDLKELSNDLWSIHDNYAEFTDDLVDGRDSE
jgi:hypothetical protein